ncbi:MAG: PEP-CTERM sorting domain-containing protein [Verrucomicrobiota bacterium JB023]|nr:PEP-CTERM sorting domain-containing protein [Verrucomicrobiota bacterium JB023]
MKFTPPILTKRLAPAFLGLLAAGTVSASTVLVNIDYLTLGDGSFQYDVTVVNDCPDDLINVNFPDAPVNDFLLPSTAMSPVGFTIDYDPGFGTLDLNAEASNFVAGSSVSGFSFQTEADPSFFASFQGFTDTFGEFSGTSTVNLIPEPTSAALVALGGLALLRRRRKA